MELSEWYIKMSIQAVALEHFTETMETYRVECPNEYSALFQNAPISEIKIDLVSLRKTTEPQYTVDTIEIVFDVRFKNRDVGWYKEIFSISGEALDEFFVTY